MLSLSDGVRVSSKNRIVYLTSYIFYPLIDPLLSITQIKSTLVLLPPLDLRVAIAGRMVAVLSLTKDLCALIYNYNFPSLIYYFAFSTSGWSSLKNP